MQPAHYKYLSIVLGLVVIAFAAFYFMQPEPTVQDVNENAGDRVQSCSDELSAWDEKYGSQASSSEKAKALQSILDGCKDELTKARNTLTP